MRGGGGGGGAYKLVMYSSLTSSLLGLSASCLCCSWLQTSVEADEEEDMCCESLHLYYKRKSRDKWEKKILLRFYYILKRNYSFYTSLELSIWRAVRFSFLFLYLWDFVLFCSWFLAALCKRMGVERCNWALCKTPNCLTSNTNSVLWLPVICEGGHTRFRRKRGNSPRFFLDFFVSPCCLEALTRVQ